MDARQFTNQDIIDSRAYYPSPSRYPLLDDEHPFLLALKMDPEKKLNEMETTARKIIEEYEHENPINQDKIVKRCLADFEKTISDIESEKIQEAKKDSAHLKTSALFQCIKLFQCFQAMADICDKNDSTLKGKVYSFFFELNVTKDFVSSDLTMTYSLIPEKNCHYYEKLKYERALKKFEAALEKYNKKEHSLLYSANNQLKKLKDDGIPINFCSLVLNTATQRLEDPTNPFLQQRLANLQNVISQQRDSTIMKYLPTLLKFVGAVVAIVGLALLAPPSLLITQLGAGLAAQTSALTALTIVSGGVATFLVGRLFPSPKRYSDASNAIENANNLLALK